VVVLALLLCHAPDARAAEAASAAERWAEGGRGGTPEFARHVLPLIGKAGCNNRACHGSFQGQNGFRLSLFGSDPAGDRKSLVEQESESEGRRRVDLKEPAKSLALLKPSAQIDHGGGQRMKLGSWQHRMFSAWIAGGAPFDPQKESRLQKLVIEPTDIVLGAKEKSPPLRLIAHFSDGTVEDVTALTGFESRDDAVATVSDDGIISAGRPGDTAIIATYGGEVTSCQVLVPRPSDGVAFGEFPPANAIDRFVVEKLRKLNIRPSELASDAVFLRRAYLDVIGTLPTPAEVRRFLADSRADKRTHLIDELLKRPEYATYWALIFSDITGNQGINPHAQVSHLWQSWLEDKLARNWPYDELVGRILTATSLEGRSREELLAEIEAVRKNIGSDAAEPYRANRQRYDKGVYAKRNTLDLYWLRIPNRQPDRVALQTAAAFLGVRLDCAQCHKHPFDRWTTSDFEHFQSFFRVVEFRDSATGGPLPRMGRIAYGRDELVVGLNNRYAQLVKRYPPKPLGGEAVPYEEGADPRVALWEWMRSPENLYFAPAIVNRIWQHYLGVGLVAPIEDFSSGNPPSNPRLLQWLAKDLVEHRFDLKHLHRQILTSRTYQLSWQPNGTNRHDRRNYSHALFRRLPAEVLVDALGSATGVPYQFNFAPGGAPAIGFSPTLLMPYPLELFGRGRRSQACGNCERTEEPALNQALYLLTDADITSRVAATRGRLRELRSTADDARVVEELYLATLSRYPTDGERAEAIKYRADCETRDEWMEDVLWSLLNVREFIFQH
jgi:hypothetical protein